MYEITLYSKDGAVLQRAQGERGANLYYQNEYQPGDKCVFKAPVHYCRVKVDSCVESAGVYLPECAFTYTFPIDGDNLNAYAPGAFRGKQHLLSITEDTANIRRNLALNPADQRGEAAAFPHAAANVETRNESVFAARNVIDGITIANGHGIWPYESWGIGARTDAYLTLDFGRKVEIDEIVLYLRADFPHDAYWISGCCTLSNGFTLSFPLKGIDGPQRVSFEKQTVTSLTLHSLVKCDQPSAFPSLRQLMVFGTDSERD